MSTLGGRGVHRIRSGPRVAGDDRVLLHPDRAVTVASEANLTQTGDAVAGSELKKPDYGRFSVGG